MQDDARQLALDSIPGMPTMLLRAATARKAPQSVPQFAPLTITANNVYADPTKLQRFNEVCGFTTDGMLPLPYPHIMAFPLHMQLMLEPEFPFTPMGAVHIRNRIRASRPLRAGEALDFTVWLSDAKQVEKGYEVTIATTVKAASETVWDDESVMLIRKGGSGVKKTKDAEGKTPTEVDSYQHREVWPLAANLGRRYAAASGDYNPIHLYPLSAKLMGFKRQIVHGMWSKSRVIAALLPPSHNGGASVDVAFKLPVYLPSSVTLLHSTDDQDSRFALKDADGIKPHLVGELRLGGNEVFG